MVMRMPIAPLLAELLALSLKVMAPSTLLIVISAANPPPDDSQTVTAVGRQVMARSHLRQPPFMNDTVIVSR